MKWSWKVARISGIDIYIHSTFVILLSWIAISYWTTQQSLPAVAEGVGFIVALFGCILLHELGHALAAQRYDIKTKDITLLPIGGLARLERMPTRPWEEFVVAIAGPMVNVVIALVIGLGLWVTGNLVSIEALAVADGPFFAKLMYVNLFLVIFNMLPAFPMDGGRVLRAILASRMEYAAATQIAANVGQIMALFFGLVGLIANPFLIFIALFVWIGAAQEAAAVQTKALIGDVPVSQAMLTDYRTLSPRDSLRDAIQLTLAGSQKDFPVVEQGRVIGILTQEDMLAAVSEDGINQPVADAMQLEVNVAESSELLENVMTQLGSSTCAIVPITHHGELVGIANLDNIGEYVRIHSALRGRESAA